MTEQPPPRLVRVTLLADERTVAGGTATTSWRYYDGANWRSIKDHPGVTLERLDCGPGMTWQTRAEVLLAPKTWLVRCDRFPNRQHQPKDPMEYLHRQVIRQRYAVRRSFFQVALGGLHRRPKEQAPLDTDVDSA